jgi:hypothetical protein
VSTIFCTLAGLERAHHQRPTDDQRLLVRQSEPLARPQRLQSWLQTGGANERVHHYIDVGVSGRFEHCLTATRVACARRRQVAGRLTIDENGQFRRMVRDLILQRIGVPVCRQRDHPKAIGEGADHVQRRLPDRTSGAQDRYTSRAHQIPTTLMKA